MDVLIPVPAAGEDRSFLGGVNVHTNMREWGLGVMPAVVFSQPGRGVELELVAALGPFRLDAWVRPNPWRNR